MIERKSDHPINEVILNRWSPRAMSKESLSDEEIFSLFEAARWAPSSYNNQPWRFIYGKKDTPHFDKLFQLLIEFNKSWCKNAALLGLIISNKFFEKNGKPCTTHSFDTGAAWENLALEGSSRGLVVHGMQGFDYDAAKKQFEIPDDFEVLAMFAVGKKAPKDTLPEELKSKEAPSSRKKVSEIAFEGHFQK